MQICIFKLFKKYWKPLLIVVAIGIGYLYFKRHDDGWAQRYEELQSSHQQQLKQIESAREEERVKLEQNMKQLQSEIESVRRQYDEQSRLLAARKKAVAKKIVEEHGKQLSDVTGFRVQKVSRP
jgi:uncharacterized protein HemX